MYYTFSRAFEINFYTLQMVWRLHSRISLISEWKCHVVYIWETIKFNVYTRFPVRVVNLGFDYIPKVYEFTEHVIFMGSWG